MPGSGDQATIIGVNFEARFVALMFTNDANTI